MNILAILALAVALGLSLPAATRFWELAVFRKKRASLGLSFLAASVAFTAGVYLARLMLPLQGFRAEMLLMFRFVLAGALVGQGWLVLTDLVPSLKKPLAIASVFLVFAVIVGLTALGLSPWVELVVWIWGLALILSFYVLGHRSAPLRRRDWDLGLFPILLLGAVVLAERLGPSFPAWLSGVSWPAVLAGLSFSMYRTAHRAMNVPEYLRRGRLLPFFRKEHGLTKKQFRILRGRLRGKTPAQVGRKLGLGARAVRGAYRRTLQKLGLKNRKELLDLVLSGAKDNECLRI